MEMSTWEIGDEAIQMAMENFDIPTAKNMSDGLRKAKGPDLEPFTTQTIRLLSATLKQVKFFKIIICSTQKGQIS